MAALNQAFDASSVEPAAPFDVIPAGKYLAQIVNSEMRDTKNGAGQYLSMELDIVEGPFQGRKLFDRLNLVNPNQQAVDIAQRTLSALCRAAGKMQVTDSEQLHHIPVIVTVKVRPAGPDKGGVEREAQNEVRGYESASGARPAPAARPSSSASRPAAPAPATAPWRKQAGA